MRERSSHQQIYAMYICTAMMLAEGHHGSSDKALTIFHQMRQWGVSPKNAFVAALGACSNLAAFEEGLKIHSAIRAGGVAAMDSFLLSALITFYSSCDRMKEAHELFIENENLHDIVVWNAMMAAFVNAKRFDQTLNMFNQLVNKFKRFQPTTSTFVSALGACTMPSDLPTLQRIHGVLKSRGMKMDPHLTSTLVSAYSRCGSMTDARAIYAATAKECRTTVVRNAMMAALMRENCNDEALPLFWKMHKEGITDTTSIRTALAACMDIDEGRKIHRIIRRDLASSDEVVSSLIQMYGRCGSLTEARELFENSIKASRTSIGLWNALMAAYAFANQPDQVKRLDEAGIEPDRHRVIFL